MSDDEQPNWYLQEWAALKDKKQADLVNELDWLKNTAHRVWHGKQPYRRDLVNAVANWLDIRPHELLMHPEEAIAIREMRANAEAIVAAGDPNRFLPKAPVITPLRQRPKRA